jgi:hypothetical protein
LNVSSEKDDYGRDIVLKASVDSGNDFHTFQEVCFPFIANEEFTSDPVFACNPLNATAFCSLVFSDILIYLSFILALKRIPLGVPDFMNVK